MELLKDEIITPIHQPVNRNQAANFNKDDEEMDWAERLINQIIQI